MKTWTEFCQEPNRHTIKQGGQIYRFINEADYRRIQSDAAVVPNYPLIPGDAEHQALRGSK